MLSNAYYVSDLTYSCKSLLLNGRVVEIQDILSGDISTHSEFEDQTIAFIKAWLTHTERFTINTSGSTGLPKKIIITRQQMEHSARMTIVALGLGKEDIAFVCLNTNYIAGKMMLARALTGNMKIVAVDPTSNPLAKNTNTFHFIALVPLQIEAILKSNEHLSQLDHTKAILIGGAAINASIKNSLNKINAPVFATYGMTETVSHIALQRLNGPSPEHFFKVLPGIKIHLDDRQCLVIESPYLTEKITTNDVVEIIDDHRFLWLGRWDNIIITGGIKVIPDEIEALLEKIASSYKITQKFLIHGIPDASLGNKLILITEGKADENWGNVLAKLKQSISKYLVPKEILTCPKFIFTNTEKIDRKATINLFMAQYFRTS